MKKIDFAQTIEESVALLGLVGILYQTFQKSGAESFFRPGRNAERLHVNLIHEWHGHNMSNNNPEFLFGIFRQCRELINPVQCALQDFLQPHPVRLRPVLISGSFAPEDVLRAIVRVKEDWAYIERYPQIVVHR